MSPTLDAIIFVTEPPEFRIEDGLVHICQTISGGARIERVMRVSVFYKTLHLARKALVEYEARGVGEVIDFPKKANGSH